MTATSTDTYHDIEPYMLEGTDSVSARCLTHMTTTTERWPDFRGAGRGFVCDEGKGLRFVTEFHGDDIDVTPRMVDLSGLCRIIRSDAEASAYGQEYGHTKAWLWCGDGKTSALTISVARAAEFDEDQWATQTWRIARHSGRVIAEVPVLIDGRA